MIPLYEEHLKSNCNELRWTCEIAYEKVKNHKLKELYGTQYNKTMEPAAPFTEKEFK